jgi:CRP/FNR family transcriptional regulator, cyclic AMP receptor protein
MTWGKERLEKTAEEKNMNVIEAAIIEHPFFQTMQPEHLSLLSANAVETQFKTEDVLFRENEPANRLFLIQTGKIDLSWRSNDACSVGAAEIGPGQVLGWSWLFPPFMWHFTAKVMEPTSAVVLDGGRLLVACETNPQFGYALMKRIAQIVIDRLLRERNAL